MEMQIQEHSPVPMDTHHPATTSYRQVLEPSMLDLFPTRTVGEELKFPVYHEPMGRNAISLTDLRESVVMEPNESPEKSRARSICNNFLYDYTDTNKTCSAEGIDGDKRVDCVICLDGFHRGDVLRQLPCGHEYHRDCIGKWTLLGVD
jgi:hypothetical protein